MRIGIICFWDRPATPYLAKYEKIMLENNIQHDVVFWDRSKSGLPVYKGNTITLRLKTSTNRVSKLRDFAKWQRMVLRVLRQNRYDFLILLSTIPAVLLSNYLLKNYRNKYIFDIRDYSLESNSIFKNRVMQLVECSKFTTISSKGFFVWLDPSPKFIINHNITYIDLHYQRVSFFKAGKQVNITFVGNVRLDGQTSAMLVNMRNNPLYNFGFVGRMLSECDLLDVCEKNSIKNVHIKGAFTEDDKPDIYSQVDIINAVYANSSENIRLADSTPLPNRVYDAVIFKRPIVASRNTYLAEVIAEYDLGFAVNGYSANVSDDFANYIKEFDENIFIKGCQKYLTEVLLEENKFREHLKTTICRWSGNEEKVNDIV
jgi:glycosyltransferase involved in cell wall biosynthesis